MNITVNGQQKETTAAPDIASLLKAEGYEGRLVAVALNGVFVPKNSYVQKTLQDGDDIEIVAPMQGG